MQKEVLPDLNARGSGRVEGDPIGVDGIGLFQGANYVSVDQPCQGIGLPVELNRR